MGESSKNSTNSPNNRSESRKTSRGSTGALNVASVRSSRRDKMAHSSHLHIPVIDVSALVSGKEGRDEVAGRIGQACRDWGFFYIVGHGVDEQLQRRLEEVSRQFFAQDLERKLEIKMSLGGRAC